MKKDVFLIILALAVVGLIVGIVIISEKANKMDKSLDEERYSRMVAEESLQKKAASLSTIEAQLKVANDKLARIQGSMDQEKEASADLQKQFDDLNKAKAELEAKIKEYEAKAAASTVPAEQPAPAAVPTQ